MGWCLNLSSSQTCSMTIWRMCMKDITRPACAGSPPCIRMITMGADGDLDLTTPLLQMGNAASWSGPDNMKHAPARLAAWWRDRQGRAGQGCAPGPADERDVLQSSIGEAALLLQVAQVHPALGLLVHRVAQMLRPRHQHLPACSTSCQSMPCIQYTWCTRAW